MLSYNYFTNFRSKQGLEEWRNQAKLKQRLREERVHQDADYLGAAQTAPFATETNEKPEMVPPQATSSNLLGSKVKVEIDYQTVQKYKTKLEEKRKQIGIISNPSSELRKAEKSLAEVRLVNIS